MRVILFAKYPEPGLVKTRLAMAVGAENAAALARCFLLDEIRTIREMGVPITVCHAPPESGPSFRALLGRGLEFRPQRGLDIGRRMANAFEEAFAEGSKAALLVGSDLPDLPLALLREAAASLEAGKAVLGPAEDGGYYLIGFPRAGYFPEAFANIPWSTSRAFESTLARFAEQGVAVHLLPSWADMDTMEDLASFAEREGSRGTSTRTLLARIWARPTDPRAKDPGG